MPKGVEHIARRAGLVGDAEVSNAVMPKGVEHKALANKAVTDSLGRVSNAVMPKGVEHTWQPVIYNRETPVSNAVMPKGVEHVRACSGSSSRSRVERSDAERR